MSHTFASRALSPEMAAVLRSLKPGQKIKITHLVRVGMQTWPAVVTGVFRHVDSLATGLATERVAADDIVVPLIHFTKDNKEMSSITLDEHTKIDLIG